MSDGADGDVLMFFVQAAGEPAIAAESTSLLPTGATGVDARLMTGFVGGRYFEAESFSFGIELADDEGGNKLDESETRSYGRWRALKPTEPKPNPPFKAEPQDVSIRRRIDSSSPVLLKHCLDTRRFDEAVLVKRTRNAVSGAMVPVVRFEFRQVWIRAVEWEDGDAVRETCKFKYAAMKATYVKRKADGTVDSQWPCEWTSLSVKKTSFDA